MPIAERFRDHFLKGLAVILPTIVTIWIFIWGYSFIQNSIGIHISRSLAWLTILLSGAHADVDRQRLIQFWVEGWGAIIGFVIALMVVFAVGLMLASMVGKALWRMVEKFIMNTPFLRQVYPYVKQVTDFLFAKDEQKKMLSRVVAVEYPRKGIWTLGFVTGRSFKKIRENTQKELLAVLMPTSPTPFTGFVIMVPQDEVIELDIPMEDALRFIISCGVIGAGNETTG